MGQEAVEGICRRPRKYEYGGAGLPHAPVQGVFSVLHGCEEVLHPSAPDSRKLRIELVKEDQRDFISPGAQGLMQRQEQLLRVAVLGQIQGGGPESAAAFDPSTSQNAPVKLPPALVVSGGLLFLLTALIALKRYAASAN